MISKGRRLILLAPVSALVGLTLAAGGAGAASNCDEKGKEGNGCTLPNGASYQFEKSDTDRWDLRKSRGNAYLILRSACTKPGGNTLKVKGAFKVGRSYSFDKTEKVVDDSDRTFTHVIDLTAKVVGAKKATVKGTISFSAPAVPPSDNSQGQDAVQETCKIKRTLKRSSSR